MSLNYFQGQRLNWNPCWMLSRYSFACLWIEQVCHICCEGWTYWKQQYYCSAWRYYHTSFTCLEYLGVFENVWLRTPRLSQYSSPITKESERKILKSVLNRKNIIITINTSAIPLLCYTTGVVKETQAEMRSLDVSTRKLSTMYNCFSKTDDVHEL